MKQEDLDARLEREYGFGPVTDDQNERMEGIREHALELARHMSSACQNNRARSLALTYLQQAKMWAAQAIVDEDVDE